MSATPSDASGPDDEFPGTPEEHSLPRTTATAVVLATALCALALSYRVPLAGLSTALGALVAVAVSRLSGSGRALTVGAAVAPVAALVLTITVVALEQSSLGGFATPLLGLVAGLAVVGAVGDVSRADLQPVGWVWLLSGLAVAATGVLAFLAWRLGGGWSLWAALRWPLGRSGVGLVVSFALAAVAVAGGVSLFPLAAVTTPARRAAVADAQHRLWRTVLGMLPIAAVAAVLLALAGVLDALASVGWLRSLLGGVTVLFGALAVVGLLVDQSWRSAGERVKPIFGWIMTADRSTGRMRNPVVAVVAGLAVGVALLVGPAIAAEGASPTTQTVLAVTAAVLVGAGVLALALARSGHLIPLPIPSTVAASALGTQAVLVTLAAQTRTVDGPTLEGVATLCALAAAVFVAVAGWHGTTLAREAGGTARRRPQLVWLGWSGTVAVVGLLVAVGLYWVATAFPPVLSGPARIGVLAGLAALSAVVWLLLRR